MPRWITPNEDKLRALGHGSILDEARNIASGDVDPVPRALTAATNRVLRAVAAGNLLDEDATKVPASLEDVTLNLALYDLMSLIGMPLSKDQSDNRRDITSDLNRISDEKKKLELADNPAASASFADTGMKVSSVNVPRRQTGRDRQSGL